MAFSRKSMAASVAGSLSLAMLTGCPAPTPTVPSASASAASSTGTPTTPPTTGTPTATPSAGTANPSPSVTPSTTTTPAATGSAAVPQPSVSAPSAAGGKLTIVSGTVYDETGATVDGAVIKVTSLDASVPYTASTTTSQGSWVVNSVPEGANVEIVATKDGWTSRRRVGSFQTNANQKNVVDFGGTTDSAGTAYFVSKYPEIASVDPIYDANNVDPTSVSYKITLSEPLDSTNQNRFANSVRIFPANSFAAPDNDASAPGLATGAGYFDLKDQKITPFTPTITLDRGVDPDANAGYSAGTTNHPLGGTATGATANVPWDYSIKNGSLFLNDANTRANITWDATGTVATFTFNAPLIADRTNQARYQMGLVAQSQTDRIVDKDNNQLGIDANGGQNTYPVVGALIHATVKQPDLALNLPSNLGNVTGGAARWIGTHSDAARFAVKVDNNNDPQLASIAYTKNLNQSSRFELTFNKPIAAYNGRLGGHVGSSIIDGSVLRKISFAVSDRTGGTNNVNLKGDNGTYGLDARSAGSKFGAGSNSPDVEKEFYLANTFANGGTASPNMGTQTAIGGNPANTSGTPDYSVGGVMNTYGSEIRAVEADVNSKQGSYLLAVNPSNPKTLFIYVVKQPTVFDTRIVELKCRAEGVPDPAGNTIKAALADQNQKTTSVQ
jgi:hypothetical protein